MKGFASPPFSHTSMPPRRQRAQFTERAVTRSSLVLSVFLIVVVLQWGSVATASASENATEDAPLTSTREATLPQSALEETSPPPERKTSTPAAMYQDSPLSNPTFSVATLPAMMLTSTMPAHNGTSASQHPTPYYGAFGAAFLSPKLYANYVVPRSGQGNYGGNDHVGNALDIRETAAGSESTHTGDMRSHGSPASVPTMTLLPAVATLSLNPDVQIRPGSSYPSSGVLPSQSSLGNVGEGTLNPSDIRYSLTPLLGTMHLNTLHPHVSPALCWTNDKYGRFPAKPWYCSLVCRLMARKVAEKEAAKHRNWKNAPPLSSPRALPNSGEWFNSKEYHRLKKAVLDASTRSPVVVFTKGHCRYCKDAIKLLQDVGVKQIYVVDLGRAPDMLKLQLVLEKLTGARTVPRIYIGGVCVGGLSDMTKEHDSGTLKERLEKASAL